MMRPYRRLAGVLAVALALLVANLSWLQVLGAEGIRGDESNTRNLLQQYNRARGPIVVGAAPIATSARAKSDSFYQRSYTDGALYASATGYYSLLYGATGIEASENDVLSGTDSRFFVDRVQQLFAGQHQAGGAVTLTLSADAQRAAFDALASRTGAVVVLDARTGAVRAMVSKPTFDPQDLAPNDPVAVRNAYRTLASDPAKPLLNRVTGRAYPVGDLFDVITATAALASGSYSMTSPVPCADAVVALTIALQRRCPEAFAEIGRRIGVDALRSTAEQFGFNNAFPITAPSVASRLPIGADPATTATGAGVRATPLQMALVAAALANNGTLMTPYLVSDVRTPNLAIVDAAAPTAFGTPVAERNAQAIAEALQSRTDAQLHLIHGSGSPSWAIAYSGRLAIAVCLEAANADASTVATTVLREISVKQ